MFWMEEDTFFHHVTIASMYAHKNIMYNFTDINWHNQMPAHWQRSKYNLRTKHSELSSWSSLENVNE